MTLNGSFTPSAPGSAPVIFDNQPATVQFNDQYFQEVEFDQLHGGSFEFDHALGGGAGLLSISVDGTATTSESYEYEPTLAAYGIPPGSQMAETTELLRGIFNLSSHLQLTLANYFNEYSYHYSNDNGVTWNNPHSWYDVPRGGLSSGSRIPTWQFVLPPAADRAGISLPAFDANIGADVRSRRHLLSAHAGSADRQHFPGDVVWIRSRRRHAFGWLQDAVRRRLLE